ncbi:MAG: polysaccharide biosynthesis protein [Terracidiphilus sp.]
MFARLARIDWHRFLARPPLPSPAPRVLEGLREERILITGAGGSIGSALARRLAALSPRGLVLLDFSESRLAALQRSLASPATDLPATYILGNVCDRRLLDNVFSIYGSSLVFHTAALKHVPLLENQPFAAVETNVFGTNTIASAGAGQGARILLLSTDKAAQPASILGATKRIAEHIVRSAEGTVLRLGNVLASSDSVAEVFARQLAEGNPLTVTDPAARRYFLTIDEAVSLLLAASHAPSALFVPALTTQHFVADLARFIARELAPGRQPRVEFSSRRPGDKERETLWSCSESAGPADTQGLMLVCSPYLEATPMQRGLAALRVALDARDLPALLEYVNRLVPDYTPGAMLSALVAEYSARVAS